MRRFVQAVDEHIKAQSAAHEGQFVVPDNLLKKNWKLKLVRIHKDRIAQLEGNRFFACADFKNKSNRVDLDFYVRKIGESWEVEQVLVHKVNGKPRFTYNSRNEMIPVIARPKPKPLANESPEQEPKKPPKAQEQPKEQPTFKPSAPAGTSPPASQPSEHAHEHPQEHPH